MRIMIQDYELKVEVEYEKHYTKSMFYTDDGIYHYHTQKYYTFTPYLTT